MSDLNSILNSLVGSSNAKPSNQQTASLLEKEVIIKEHTINNKYDQIRNSKKEAELLKSITSDNTFKGDMADIYTNARIAFRKNMPFISKELSDKVPMVAGSLVLVGGMTGIGKSTTTANIVRRFYKDKKKVLIITNEEVLESVVNRISFMEVGIDYNTFRKDDFSITPEQEAAIIATGNDIVNYVTVKDRPIEACKLEGVKSLLDDAKAKKNYDVIILDYFQAVSESVQNKSRVEILYELRDYLKDYCREDAPPIILFAQLSPLDPQEKDRNMEIRTKWIKGLMEAASSALEIVREPNIPVTRFVITKSRWGYTGKDVYYKYKKGEFIPINFEEKQQIEKDYKANLMFQAVVDF